jgi:LPS sulfotransferase NodH
MMSARSQGLSYWICSSPRSGSEVLAHLVIDTDLAGRPREFYGRSFQKRYESIRAPIVDYGGYFMNLKALGSTSNGVFGAKIFWPHYENVVKNLTAYGSGEHSAEKIIDVVLPNHRYISLRRKDRLRQAISLYRASVTKVWRSDRPAIIEARCDFNFDIIDSFMSTIEGWSDSWDVFFKSKRISPMEIFYEEMIFDFGGTIKRLLDYLGLDYSKKEIPSAPRFEKQSDDEITDEWVDLFDKEKALRQSGGRLPSPK